MTQLANRIEPFRALLYNIERVGDLRDVIAPPYDLIDAIRQQQLYDRSPYNVVRLELGREPDRYGASAATLAKWRSNSILRLAPRPAIYQYTQLFEVGGNKLRRDGFVVRLRLEEFGRGRILPHEKTFPAAKEDRLKLLTALNTNVSSVFGLYSGKHDDLDALSVEVAKRPPEARVIDDLGIENQLRAIEAPEQIAIVQRALDQSLILIADGHHRYETALNYRNLRRTAEGNPAEPRAYEYTMMTLIACDSPGLVILPTHRVVKKLDAKAIESFENHAREIFEVEEFQDRDRMRSELIRRGRRTIGVALRGKEKTWLLSLRDRSAIEAALPQTPNAVRELDVSILHALVFDKIFGIKPDAIKAGGNLEYTIDARGALEAVSNGLADGVFLMNPPSIEDVQRVSDSGATMPEKSTYFFPKLITGLFMNPLDVD
ncbi:MAG TPA: DUF1015 domain-containing protein [Candidatus Binataceae bacterium]|nr:DUF1015 domain-containing protein [Candidatus Binataceae bacterium]